MRKAAKTTDGRTDSPGSFSKRQPLTDRDLMDQLWQALRSSDIIRARDILSKHEIDPNTREDMKTERGQNGYTLLIYACRNGWKDIAELLIAKGADVNLRDNNGQTPLMQAAKYNRLEVIKLLVEKEADVNAVCGNLTAARLAERYAYDYVVAYLAEHGAPWVKTDGEWREVKG